jgi:hypothetical protein
MACIARQGDPPRQYASPEESLVISDPKAPGIIKLEHFPAALNQGDSQLLLPRRIWRN